MTNSFEPQPQPDPQPQSHSKAQPADAALAAISAETKLEAPSGSLGSWSVWLWVGGGLLLVAVLTSLMVIAFDYFGKSTSGTGARQPGGTYRTDDGQTAAASARAAELPELQLSDLPPEEKPPVADWQVLNRAQLRYCVAENFRLKTVFGLVRSDVPVDADVYTMRLADYKARCQNLSNPRDEQQQMVKVVETARTSIEASARSDWASTQTNVPASNASVVSANQPSLGANKDTKSMPSVTEPGKPATVAPMAEPVKPMDELAKAHQPKPRLQVPKEFDWCVEGRCARL